MDGKLQRKKTGKTQIRVAEDLGITKQALSLIEKGQKPSARTVIKLLEYYKPDLGVKNEEFNYCLRYYESISVIKEFFNIS